MTIKMQINRIPPCPRGNRVIHTKIRESDIFASLDIIDHRIAGICARFAKGYGKIPENVIEEKILAEALISRIRQMVLNLTSRQMILNPRHIHSSIFEIDPLEPIDFIDCKREEYYDNGLDYYWFTLSVSVNLRDPVTNSLKPSYRVDHSVVINSK